MKNLCVIPARGGSRRIPRKNIREFLGKPIIAYSIEASLHSGVFDTVMVSTDDAEIAAIAREFGASVPFMRSPKTSDDHTGLADVLLEVLAEFATTGIEPTTMTCVLPTAPLIQSHDLRHGVAKLEDCPRVTSVVSVVRYSHPVQRCLCITDTGELQWVWPENRYTRSQDLEARYHDAGQFYVVRPEALAREKTLVTSAALPVELPEIRVQDIDTVEDWRIAEFKCQYASLHSYP